MAAYDFKNLAQSTCVSPLTNVATAFTLVSTTTMSTTGQAVLRIDDTGVPGSTKVELVLFLGANNNTGTNTISSLTRGVGGTSAQAFGAGFTVSQVVDSGTLLASFARLDTPSVAGVGSALAAPGRYVGNWSTFGAPTGLTAILADHGFDGNNNLWICSVAGTPGTWKPMGTHRLDEQSVTGVVSCVVPPSGSLPLGYRNLRVTWKLRDTVAAVSALLSLRLSGNATGYVFDYIQSLGTAVTAVESVAGVSAMTVGSYAGSTAPANHYGDGELVVFDYNSGTEQKVVTFNSFTRQSTGASSLQYLTGGGLWNNVLAATTVTLISNTAFSGVVTTYGF